jgi:hypothetical protein
MTELADRIIGHYEKHARNWGADRRNSGWNDKVRHDRFIAALPNGGTVARPGLQVGVTRGAPYGRMRASGHLPDQEWIVADMRPLALGRQFAGVLARDSFFHLKPDDQRATFEVFAAHAARSAILMFNTGPAYGEGIGCYRGDPLHHASLDAAEYEKLLTESGFEVVVHMVEDRQAGGRTVWIARSRD